MKRLIFLAALLEAVVLLGGVACAPKGAIEVRVENPTEVDRRVELVEVEVAKLGRVVLAEGQAWVVKNAAGEVVPSQVTHDGLLVFPSGLGSGKRAVFAVEAGERGEFEAKTYGRVAPERYDDFIWENDRVAFRIYGAALIPIDGPSNGIDALYKRVEQPILDRWYGDSVEKGLSYHDDNGTGLDDYKVGRTLGAGGMAPRVDGKLVLNSNYVEQELLDNGPLRTTFRLTYPVLEVGGVTVAETRTFSIDAGSQMTRVMQEYGGAGRMQVAVGYPRHAEEVEYEAWGDVVMVNEPATRKASGVYLGLVVPGGIEEVVANSEGHILALAVYDGKPMVYYTGFGWERFGDWTAERFEEYLRDFDQAVRSPLKVRVR